MTAKVSLKLYAVWCSLVTFENSARFESTFPEGVVAMYRSIITLLSTSCPLSCIWFRQSQQICAKYVFYCKYSQELRLWREIRLHQAKEVVSHDTTVNWVLIQQHVEEYCYRMWSKSSLMRLATRTWAVRFWTHVLVCRWVCQYTYTRWWLSTYQGCIENLLGHLFPPMYAGRHHTHAWISSHLCLAGH